MVTESSLFAKSVMIWYWEGGISFVSYKPDSHVILKADEMPVEFTHKAHTTLLLMGLLRHAEIMFWINK